MTIFATIMLLQTAIAYGNEAMTANELATNQGAGYVPGVFDPNSYAIMENCGSCEGTTCPEGTQCAAVWTCDASSADCPEGIEGLRIRTYKVNSKIRGPANAAVTFSVFMFLLSLFQVYFLNTHQQEIAGGGAGPSSGGGNYSAPAAASAAPAAAATGEGYQRL